MMFALTFPYIDPVAISIGPLSIRWYGLSYMVGLILGWMYVRSLLRRIDLWPNKIPPLKISQVDDLLIYMALAVILGGRLGYVIFYEPNIYLAHPLEIFKVWKGGMSFHGAILGSIIGITLFSLRTQVPTWSVLDLCAAATPLGLFFGRLANFINGELYGRVTDVAWGMVFPNAKYLYPNVEPATRHPSQIYEALLEGLFLFLFLRYLTHKKLAFKSPGLVAGYFFAGYGCARIFAEIFREPHFGHILNMGPISVGQVYSLPMVLAGLYAIFRAQGKKIS
ncbi:MAG: prolipoprotein diacylglyceryl transferase [Hyphomicrobium sp.]